MKLQIRKSCFSWNMLSENNILVAKIKRKNPFYPARIITDPDGKEIYTTDIINLPITGESWNCADSRKYIIYQNHKIIATATFSYAKNPERTIIQKFILRPPQIDELVVETPFGLWKIKRQKDNSVVITNGNHKLGIISAFFSCKVKYLELFNNCNPIFMSGIYVLVDYMMHEDDLIVV